MIRKAAALMLSVLAGLTAIVAVLSYMRMTDLPWEQVGAVVYPTDLAFAWWFGIPLHGTQRPRVRGLLVRRDLDERARVYVHACRGAIIISRFVARKGVPGVRPRVQRGCAGFALERATAGPFTLCFIDQQYLGPTGEQLSFRNPAVDIIAIRFPLWALFALLPLYPAAAFIRGPVRRWRRRRKGCCVTCGYDLTGVCPECGESSPTSHGGQR